VQMKIPVFGNVTLDECAGSHVNILKSVTSVISVIIVIIIIISFYFCEQPIF
jgi:hypothetical protein